MDQAKEKIKSLVDRYEKAKLARKIEKYTEEETKNAFIKPLFEALEWDFSEKDEVSAEEHIISSGRVDYGFYINGRAKFYLEAKPLRADLHREEFANQAIKYSWNKGVTWAILTDFESIKVFNAQAISKYLGDKLYFEIEYHEYLERFEQLWLLSKSSFEKDLIDVEAEKAGKKLQKIPITELLYKDLNQCRSILTRSLGEWNKNVSRDLLDEGVQKLLDRLIFIRVAEDRNIEENILIPLMNQWKILTGSNKPKLFQTMTSKFRELDKIYNSDLFTPHPFENWETDGYDLEQVIKILKGKQGYYEYDFSVLPADVLGSVYENYLGYKLSQSQKGLTLDKSAGKRKEQGIYYTPVFIVDYIVRNSLKPVLDRCLSISDLKKIKILDPACGSGSFLIKALEVINEKYREFGNVGDELTKIQILQENIYGVDLDEQAVEIARLNLLINALEQKGKLPSLDKNIKNGNSLISGTVEELEKYFGENYRDKKPFNWEEQFPEVFKEGGFDVIIGNPPYIRVHKLDKQLKKYLWFKYHTFKAKSDIYACFMQRSIDLLKNHGSLSFIVSKTWFSLESFTVLRKFILDTCQIIKLTSLPAKIFKDATVETTVVVFRKEKLAEKRNLNAIIIERFENEKFLIDQRINQANLILNHNYLFSMSSKNDKLIEKIKINSTPLKKLVNFYYGFKTGDDKKFLTKNSNDSSNRRPVLRRRDFGKYISKFNNEYVLYEPGLMVKNKSTARPGTPERFEQDKILVQDIAKKIVATIDRENYYIKDALILIPKLADNIEYLLAILNSKIARFFYKNSFQVLSVAKNAFLEIPIKVPDQKSIQFIKIAKLVNRILALNIKFFKTTKNSNEWETIKDEIEEIDRKIDEEIFVLYGLIPEEIKIVENS